MQIRVSELNASTLYFSLCSENASSDVTLGSLAGGLQQGRNQLGGVSAEKGKKAQGVPGERISVKGKLGTPSFVPRSVLPVLWALFFFCTLGQSI